MKFKTGDLVKFLNSVQKGKVISYKNNSTQVLVLVDDFYQEYVDESELLLETNSEYNFDDNLITQKINDDLKKYQNKNNKYLFREVDLHFENVSLYDGFTDYQKLLKQIDRFNKAIKNAISDNIIELTIIHGVGTGRLREEIKRELDVNFPHFEHYDRDISLGATVVVLKRK